MKAAKLELVSGLRARFSQGIVSNLVATSFLQGSVLVGNIIVARLLGSEEFGIYNMVLSTLMTVAGLAQFATGVTATRYVAQYRVNDKAKTARILVFLFKLSCASGIAGTVLVFLSSDWLALKVLDRPGVSNYLVVSAAYVLFSVISGYFTGALAGLEAYRSLAVVSPIQGLIHVALCGGGAWLWGGQGAVSALMLSAAFRWLLLSWILYKEADKLKIPWRSAKARNEQRLFGRFSVPATLAGLSSLPALWFSNIFLVQQVDGYREIGLYGAAFSLRSLIIIFPIIVNNVTTSFLNHQLGIGNDKQYRKLFKMNIFISASIALTGIMFVVLLGRWILGIFGADFQAGYAILVILALSTIPETLQIAIYQVIQSRGRMWLSLYGIAIPRDLSMVAMAYYLTRDHGASGLAVAYTGAWSIALLCTALIVWKLGFLGKIGESK